MRAPRYLAMAMASGTALFVLLGASMANAQESSTDFVISAGPYELESGDAGVHTLSVTVSNPSREALSLVVAATASEDPDCASEPVALDPRTSKKLQFTLPATCAIDDDGIELVLDTADGGEAIELSASPADEASDYGALWLYLLGGVLALIVVAATYATWEHADADGRRLTMPLPGIKSDWSFKDSWASNVGLAATIFTGVLGASDVLEKLLGDDADNAVVLALVSAGLSAALIGAAPLLLTIFKGGEGNKSNTAIGVVLATLVVLAANLGQISVMAAAVIDAGAISENAVVVLAISAALVIVVYYVRSVHITLTSGVVAPPTTPSDTLLAATMIRDALQAVALGADASVTSDEVTSMFDAIEAGYPPVGTSPGDERLASAAMP